MTSKLRDFVIISMMAWCNTNYDYNSTKVVLQLTFNFELGEMSGSLHNSYLKKLKYCIEIKT